MGHLYVYKLVKVFQNLLKRANIKADQKLVQFALPISTDCIAVSIEF